MTTRIFELVILVKVWIAVVCIMALCILVGGYRHVTEEHISTFYCKYCGSSVCVVIPGLNVGKATQR
jgi:hypothetical protein